MFDYAGLSEKKLFRLCSRSFASLPLSKVPYWTVEAYSIGRYLKEYANIPEWMPLFVYSQHGVPFSKQIWKNEIENDAEAMLVFSPDALSEYKRVSDKPCYHVTMPYVLHRRSHNITPSPDAKGTLIFPYHSTPHDDVIFGIDKYVSQLRALPIDFHPLCICFHMHDIDKGLHREFIKRGLPVYTAGNAHDVFFGDRVYSLMRQFKYTASNTVGSYTFYSVEMGIPFSLFGDAGECIIHTNNPNAPVGPLDRLGVKMAADVFSGIHTRITSRQKEFTEHVLGIGKGISSKELRQILLNAYQKRRGNATRNAVRVCKRRVKRNAVQFVSKIMDLIAP